MAGVLWLPFLKQGEFLERHAVGFYGYGGYACVLGEEGGECLEGRIRVGPTLSHGSARPARTQTAEKGVGNLLGEFLLGRPLELQVNNRPTMAML